MVAHERLTESRVTIKWLFAKRNSLSNLPAFLATYGRISSNQKYQFVGQIENLRFNFKTYVFQIVLTDFYCKHEIFCVQWRINVEQNKLKIFWIILKTKALKLTRRLKKPKTYVQDIMGSFAAGIFGHEDFQSLASKFNLVIFFINFKLQPNPR